MLWSHLICIWALFQTLKHTEGHHLNLRKFMNDRA